MEIEPVIAAPRIPYKTALIIGVVLAIILNFSILLSLSPFHIPYTDKLLYSRYLLWLNVLLLWLYAYKFEHSHLLLWKERAPDFLFFIGSLVILFILCFASSVFSHISHVFGVHDNRELLKKINHLLKGHYVLIVFTAFTAGATEELIIRGYLLPRLSLLIKNEYAPIVISAVIFSLFHFAYQSIDEYIFTFLFGIITAFYYRKFRSIKALIAFHFFYDLFAMLTAQHYLK